jgi:hypothetical protein
MLPLYMSRDSLGRPIVFAEPLGGIGADTGRYDWADSTWVSRWLLGYDVSVVWPNIAPPGQEWLLWKNNDDQTPPAYVQSTLVLAEDLSGVLSPPDTVALVYEYATEYAVAASARRRWVAVADRPPPTYNQGVLRLLYSDTVKVWHEVPITGIGDEGVTVGALDDTSAVVVWSGLREGVRWGTLRGSAWASTGEELQPSASSVDYSPRLRRHPHGGYWLVYAAFIDNDTKPLKLLRYLNGAWTRVDSVACAFDRNTDQYTYQSASMSMDEAEYPSIAWSAFSNVIGLETVCACMSSDSGFTPGDNVQPSDGGFLPGITRDPNGDIWIAWWKYYDGMFWTHTFASARTSAPRLSGTGRQRMLRWALSQPSPETWWAVMRSREGAPFEVAARVRAGPDTLMSWSDTTAPNGALRYKIRRESVDVRYQWESPEAVWPLRVQNPIHFTLVPTPLSAAAQIELSGAVAGMVDVTLYDLQGRALLRQHVDASGSGIDRFSLDPNATTSRLSSGVYFLRARDASGSESSPCKIVLLR